MADEPTTQPTIEESITALQTSSTNILARLTKLEETVAAIPATAGILARLTKLETEVSAIPTTTTDPAVAALTEKLTNLGDALDRHGIR